MDNESKSAVRLLETLQSAERILSRLANNFRLKGANARSFLSLSGTPFTVHRDGLARVYRGSALLVISVDGPVVKGIELYVDILWDDSQWTIMTEAWMDDPVNDGQIFLRALPEIACDDLSTCLSTIPAACESLVGFEDLVFSMS